MVRVLTKEAQLRIRLIRTLQNIQWDRFETKSLEGLVEGIRSGMMEKQKLKLKS